jgi:hypothetical protein
MKCATKRAGELRLMKRPVCVDDSPPEFAPLVDRGGVPVHRAIDAVALEAERENCHVTGQTRHSLND